MTADDIRRILWNHYYPRWAVVFEVGAVDVDSKRERRVDALLVRRAPRRETAAQRRARWDAAYRAAHERRAAVQAADGQETLFPVHATAADLATAAPRDNVGNGGIERLAIEIKVSRGDFLHDVKNPSKQTAWRELAERHAFCVPAGLVRPGEVPPESGLMEISPGGFISWTRRAPRSNAAAPLPLGVQLNAFYRWSAAEALTRGFDRSRSHGDEDVQEMRARLARLEHELELSQGERERLANQLTVSKQRYAMCATPPPCSTCGRPLRPGRKGETSGFMTWSHLPADEVECRPQRRAAAVAGWKYATHLPDPGPPEPADIWNVEPENLVTHPA